MFSPGVNVSTKRDYKPNSTWKNRRNVRRQGLFVITLALVGLLDGAGGGRPGRAEFEADVQRCREQLRAANAA